MTDPLRRLSDLLLQLFALIGSQFVAWPGSATLAGDASEHWSFKAVTSPAVPDVKNTTWARNPIDQFILARLESHGIAPSGEADRVTLIRRLSLDLLGLPPAPADVDAFLRDERADAYERLVDRLLVSPHFGERWGRHWLDLARYADSDGYEKDSPRPYAYLYRNWVINAINRDLPFDQFTIEQLAGDLLPDATLEQRLATGFHRNTLTNKEGGVDPEEFRNKANVDRVNTTATVWLGLTLACCECHNHKYDPFTQRDYYGLFSFFNTSVDADLPAPQAGEVATYEQAKKRFDEEHAKLTSALAQFEKEELPRRVAEWEAGLGGEPPREHWLPLQPLSVASAGGATLAQQADGSIQVAGKSPASDTYTIEARTPPTAITAFRLEVLPEPSHPAMGPGRVQHGNFVLNEFTVKRLAGQGTMPVLVPLHNAVADFSQDKYAVTGAIDGNPGTGWAIAPQMGQRHVAVFEVKDLPGSVPLESHDAPPTLLITLDQQFGTEHTIARFRLSVTGDTRPVPLDDVSPAVIETLGIPQQQRREEQTGAIVKYYRTIDPDWKKLHAAVTAHAKKAPPPPATKAMTIAQNSKPPATHIHIRGDFLRKGDQVRPATPVVLPALQSISSFAGAGEICDSHLVSGREPADHQPDRMQLARWLVDPSNPLTARVTVNRVWQHLFGRGLVATPNDFGTRGEPPSHPELLDWLAREFVTPVPHADPAGQPGMWSQKALIKLIVSSATYRQSSGVRGDLAERDPTNVLLARQNRYRLEAEIVRDLHLAASGLLAPVIGGPSVRPPQPAGVSELTYAGSAKWVESAGADRYRRGLYTWFQRTSPYPMLTTFDSPDGVNCTVFRERSNTPIQALTLLNDAAFVECARGLARRTVETASSADTTERVRHMFRLCMSREPSAIELARLVQLHAELTAACRANHDSAARLVGGLELRTVDSIELAAWIAHARTVMNLDEFVTRE